MTDERFEQAARAYGDAVYRVALHAVGRRTDAEDVAQTVLMKLYQYPGEFEGEEHLKRWLLRVAVNESRRLLRSPWRRRTVPLEEWDGCPARSERGGEVLDAVMALEGKYRVPVYLYYYEGYPAKEIAAILGTNPSTVQTRLQRAREKLRLALTGPEQEGTGYVRPQILP